MDSNPVEILKYGLLVTGAIVGSVIYAYLTLSRIRRTMNSSNEAGNKEGATDV